jgi:hypothetical protein
MLFFLIYYEGLTPICWYPLESVNHQTVFPVVLWSKKKISVYGLPGTLASIAFLIKKIPVRLSSKSR